MNDQAASLRKLVEQQLHEENNKSTRVITVTSGKGGVGKSNFSLNFALSLQRLGKKVLLFDADIGMANIDVLMGQSSPYNLYHLLTREKTIQEIIATGPENLHYINGGSGVKDLLQLSPKQLDIFTYEMSQLHGLYDIILFDTGAGLSNETARFVSASDETIVVTSPEPTAITDAYALIKMLTSMRIKATFRLVVNRALDDREGERTMEKLQKVAAQFLQLEIPSLGIVPDDSFVSKAVRRQIPFILCFPNCPASRAIDQIAMSFLNMEQKSSLSGGIKGFFNKLFKIQ
ncbi:MinD/ParA family protein [Paenibacillus yanchengensis]|uniref:MinD/ParA family protein n=1 Tax=Paenibacillus yanchengensis TaxID=2035833 RepID=A0ABW4YM93_9BACL